MNFHVTSALPFQICIGGVQQVGQVLMHKGRREGRKLSGFSLGCHSLSGALHLLAQAVLSEKNALPFVIL